LDLRALRPEQKFTQPPPRFSEATLVKELEEDGIGRPSTYASILGTLQDRDYVVKVEGRFKPTYLGFIITDILTRNFDDILDVGYTARMEEQLDAIEQESASDEEIAELALDEVELDAEDLAALDTHLGERLLADALSLYGEALASRITE